MQHAWLYSDLLQAFKREHLGSGFSTDGTLISVSTVLHCRVLRHPSFVTEKLWMVTVLLFSSTAFHFPCVAHKSELGVELYGDVDAFWYKSFYTHLTHLNKTILSLRIFHWWIECFPINLSHNTSKKIDPLHCARPLVRNVAFCS